MKKIILSAITLGAITTVALLNFTSFNNASNLQADKSFAFTNYNSTTGLASNAGTGVAFSDEGVVAYASAGGLSIGAASGDSYNFTNYNVTSQPNLGSNDGRGVAFDSNGDVGYVSFGGGLSIGEYDSSDASYTFTNYNQDNSGFLSNNGTGVAFDSSGDVAYCASGGGLTIGIKDDTNGYTFNNYSVTLNTPGIISDDGTGVAFDNRGDVGYVSLLTGGLSVGTRTGSTFSFTNYNTSNDGIVSSRGQAVAFDDNDNAGYAASTGGGLSIGTNSNGNYAFKNYNTTNGDLTNGSARGVGFSSAGDVGYVSNGGGLSVGVQNSSGYSFTNYSLSNETAGITNDSGTSVAFYKDTTVAYASGGGLSIGLINNPTVSIVSSDFEYVARTDDNNLNISVLPISFGYPLRQLPSGDYVQILIKDNSDSSDLVAFYLTSDGDIPSGVPSVPESAGFQFHSDDDETYDLAAGSNGITNSGAGFEENKTYAINVNLVASGGTPTTLLDETAFAIPNNGHLPTVSFDANDLNFIESSAESNLYTINNLKVNFSYPLSGLTSGEYILITIDSGGGDDLVGIAITESGQAPADPTTPVSDYRAVAIHQDNSKTYAFNNINNDGNEFAANTVLSLNMFVIDPSDSGTVINRIYGETFNTPEASSDPINPSNSNNSSNNGAIIGGVVGGIGGAAVLSATGLGSYLVFRRKRKSV